MRKHAPPTRVFGTVVALFFLLTILPGCDSYNLSLKNFFENGFEDGSVPIFHNAEDLAAYLAKSSEGGSSANPVSVRLDFSLGSGGWTNLLNTINGADKYVSLDLSACDISGMGGASGEFDPTTDLGDFTSAVAKQKVVSLVLPAAATSIKGDSLYITFAGFSNLKEIKGANVATIGQNAFSDRTNLTSVSFPLATHIYAAAFFHCYGLTSASFPAAVHIGQSAFNGCRDLTSLTLGTIPPVLGLNVFGSTFYNLNPLYIHVPVGAVGNYTTSVLPGWGVSSTTAANNDPMGTDIYGLGHKTIIITDGT
ncbi:MAG: leucine-rich repeat domain-containing protein [Treponema sp.]|jgi:hypothetical protein|nr:leucine-rich repeat domain-containing protein [Treponema sp.]